jgi:hypothetical protein
MVMQDHQYDVVVIGSSMSKAHFYEKNTALYSLFCIDSIVHSHFLQPEDQT